MGEGKLRRCQCANSFDSYQVTLSQELLDFAFETVDKHTGERIRLKYSSLLSCL